MNLSQVLVVCATSAIGGFCVRAAIEALYYRQVGEALIIVGGALALFFDGPEKPGPIRNKLSTEGKNK